LCVWNILKKVGSILLFVLYLGYIAFKAPVFTEFRVFNLVEYVLVLLVGGYTNYLIFKKEIYPLFWKNN